MCGIAGFIDLEKNKSEGESLITSMLYSIKHRGPDFSDFKWVDDGIMLGHNRLSILDLSEDGNQPFCYNHFTIVFNGEVYNYLELKKELEKKGYRFKTKTDTEVIIVAYQEWGSDCVNRFVGMWAFAIWDNIEKKLFCSRDRFGIKPFYYFISNNSFYFASEVKALKQVKNFPASIDSEMISLFLHLGWHTYSEKTLYSNIFLIPSGCNLTINRDLKITLDRYWDIDLIKPKLKISEEEATKEVKRLFENSIDLHMRSDVPVGTTLSGGIDSSAITSVVAERFPDYPLNSFSIYYTTEKNMDEREFINAMVKKYNNITSIQKEPSEQEILNELDHFLAHQDFPLLGSSFLSHFFVMKMAKEKGMKVLLDGQGADEYFVGYLRSFYRIVGAQIASKKGIEIFKAHIDREGYDIKESLSRFGKCILSSVVDDQKMLEIEYLYSQDFISNNRKIPFQVKHQKGEKLNEFLYNLLFYSELPRLLNYTDLNSMYYSFESRVPFLDHRLVEFLFQIPDHCKVKNGITKYLLRESCKSYLPQKIYSRKDKKGFVTPGEIRWLRGPLKNSFEKNFEFPPEINLINQKINQLKKEYLTGNDKNSKLVWRLNFLNRWLNG